MYEPVEHTQTFNLCSFLDRAEQLGAVFARTRNLYIQAPGSCEPVRFSFRCCTPAPGDFLGIVTEVGSSWTLLNSRTLGVFWSRIFHKPLASLRFVTLHGNSSRSGCFVSRPQRLLRWSAKLLAVLEPKQHKCTCHNSPNGGACHGIKDHCPGLGVEGLLCTGRRPTQFVS